MVASGSEETISRISSSSGFDSTLPGLSDKVLTPLLVSNPHAYCQNLTRDLKCSHPRACTLTNLHPILAPTAGLPLPTRPTVIRDGTCCFAFAERYRLTVTTSSDYSP